MGRKKNKNKSSNEAGDEPEQEEGVPNVKAEDGNTPKEENKEGDSKMANGAEAKEETAGASKDTKDEDDTTKDGVKILEEVFGKTNAESTSDDTPSVSSADGGSSPKAEPKEEAKQASASQDAAASMGPAIPTETDYDEEELKKAEEHKTQGNEFFKNCKYEAALDAYSEAIYCNVPPAKKAVYYSNRSLVSIKTENYALALFDAKDAIKQDETFVKAYYRQGSAHLALNQIEQAIEAFKTVCKMQPNNKDAREKYDQTVKEHRLRQFQMCLGYESQKVSINVEDIAVEASYAGPRLEKSTDEIDSKWVESLMKWQKDQKVLHKKYACMIIQRAKEIFEKCKSMVDIQRGDDEEITVCGDIHGQYYDLLNIFEINGIPSEANPYVFNGDFIDRGSFSVEVIICMLSWKVCYPNHFFMSRGNHETMQLNKLYGFYGEVKHKYDQKTYDLFNELFQKIPLSHCINKKVFVTHGGLFSKDGIKLEDIRKTNRFKEPGDEGIMCDCLWSDPSDINGRQPSKRGISVMFGPDVTQRFLTDNDLQLVVRSHEVKPSGFEYQKGGKCLTIFSAPNYCDQMGNKGAFIRFKGDTMEPKIESFEKVPHPKIPPMAYSSGFGGLF